MFRKFLMRKMFERQMKGVSQGEQEKILKVLESNPEFFQKIAEEVKKKTDAGKDQMAATMEVMQENQAELQKMFGQSQ